jgi:hypothetical protein
LREAILEPRHPKKEKPMSKSGFERRLDEEAKQRRRLREQGADDKLNLDAGEKQQIKDSLAELLDDADLTARQLDGWCREIIGEVRRDPQGQVTAEQYLQVLHGSPLPERRRHRDRSGMSNERFLEEWQGGDGGTPPYPNYNG